MTLDPEFLSMMPHTLNVEPYASRDAWGNPVYSGVATYQARVVNKRRKAIDRDGEEVVSNTTIYVDDETTIKINDRITLPSGYYPARPPIIGIARYPDEFGAYYTEIYA